MAELEEARAFSAAENAFCTSTSSELLQNILAAGGYTFTRIPPNPALNT